MNHTGLQHSHTYYEYFEIPGTSSHFSDHITHEFQCDTCGFKVIKDSELKSHIHVKCENCKTILGDAFDLEYYKDKFHGSNSNNPEPPAGCLCGYCRGRRLTMNG